MSQALLVVWSLKIQKKYPDLRQKSCFFFLSSFSLPRLVKHSPVRRSYSYRELMWLLYARGTIPGVRVRPSKKNRVRARERVQRSRNLPGTSAGSPRLPYRTRNLRDFWKTSIPVRGTSVRAGLPFCREHTRDIFPGTTRTRTDIHTRTGNICKLYTPMGQYLRNNTGVPSWEYPGCGSGYPGNAFVYVPTRNFWWFLKNFHTRPRKFCESWKTPIPLPGIHKPYRTHPWIFTHLLLLYCSYCCSVPYWYNTGFLLFFNEGTFFPNVD